MRIALLGPFELASDAQPIVLGRPMLRALVAILALAEGREVSVDVLADGIWGEGGPQSPKNAIHVGISRLRASLDADAERVVSSAGGYAFGFDRGDCDVTQAVDCLVAARAATRDGEHEQAVESCRHALRLWRGAPLLEFEQAPFAQRWSRRLIDLRLGLMEVRNDGWLSLGRPAEVLDDIEDAIDLDPWREHVRGQEMLALYRSGRQAAAIAVYERLRAGLARELGVEPVPQVRALYRAVLEHDPAIDGRGAPPDARITVGARTERAAMFARVAATIEAATEREDDTRARLLVALAEVQHDAGDSRWYETASSAFAIASGVNDLALIAETANVGAHGWSVTPDRVDDDRITGLRRATEAATDDDTIVRLAIALLSELTFSAPLAERLELTDHALAAARRSDNPANELFVLSQAFHAIWTAETLDRRDHDSAEALQIATKFQSPFALGIASGLRMIVAIEQGDVSAVDHHRERFAQAAERSGAPTLLWGVPLHGVWRAILDGDLDRAETLCFEALGVGERAGRPEARVSFLTELVGVRWAQGRLAEEVVNLEELVDAAPGLAAVRSWLATALLAADRRDEAAALLTRASGTGFDEVHQDQLRLGALVLYAELAHALDDGVAATRLVQLLEPFAGQVVFTGLVVFGLVDHALGLLARTTGDADAAERRLRAAHAQALAMPSPFLAARALAVR